jgi:hypothetical protein
MMELLTHSLHCQHTLLARASSTRTVARLSDTPPRGWHNPFDHFAAALEEERSLETPALNKNEHLTRTSVHIFDIHVHMQAYFSHGI